MKWQRARIKPLDQILEHAETDHLKTLFESDGSISIYSLSRSKYIKIPPKYIDIFKKGLDVFVRLRDTYRGVETYHWKYNKYASFDIGHLVYGYCIGHLVYGYWLEFEGDFDLRIKDEDLMI